MRKQEKEGGAYGWLTLCIASLGSLGGSLDSAVNIAFPAITAAFHLDVPTIQWVVISYVLTYASLLIGCGRLADMFGRKTVFVCGLVISTIAFTLCGLAPTYGLLLFFRVLQGIGAALLFASAPAMVTVEFPAAERGKALGLLNMSTFIGLTSGPVMGGVLVDYFGWGAVYLFRVPLTLITGVLAVVLLHEVQEEKEGQRFDLVGAATLALSVVGFLLLLSRGRDLGWSSPFVLMLILGSALAFSGFLFTEWRVREPVVDLALFRNPAFTLANMANMLANSAMFAVWLLVPYYIVDILRYPATSGGILLAPCPLGMALAAPLSGWLSDRFGTHQLSIAGLAAEAVGLFLVSRLAVDSSYGLVVIALGLVGLGIGIFQVPNMNFVMGAIPRAQQGVAAGMTTMMRTLGVVIGVTIAGAIFSARRPVYLTELGQQYLSPSMVELHSFLGAFQDAFTVATGICVAALLLALIPGRPRPAVP